MRLVLLLAAALFAGCASPAAGNADVLATFYPLEFAAQRLIGDNVSVATLVPAGIEPHDWEPSTPDLTRLSASRVVLAQGAGFEPWLAGLVANLGDDAPRIVDSTANMTLAAHEEEEGEGHEEERDPHTWIAPRPFAQQVAALAQALAEEFPEHASAIEARHADLQAELATLHDEHAEGLRECEVRVIVANHDAYGYLAREYDFEVVALSGLSPEAEPDPQTIARAIEVAREHNLTIIFFEELVSPRVAQIVADEVQAEARVLSPIEGKPAEGDLVTLMRANLVNLREAMRCT